MMSQSINAEQRARATEAKGQSFQWAIERELQGRWVPVQGFRSSHLRETSGEARTRYVRRYPQAGSWTIRAVRP